MFIWFHSVNSKDNRTHFTDHSKWLSSLVPSPDKHNPKSTITKPRHLAASIGKPSTAKGTSLWAIPKSNEPGPGAYETVEAIKNSQWAKVKGTSKKTEFPLCFTDKHKNMFSHVPGSGHYKQVETAQARTSKDINFKYKRH